MLERFLPLGRLLLLLVTTMVIVLSFCGTPAEAAPPRTCVSALMSTAFRLPDGELHPAGRLTLCRARAFSPVAELHLISVNRRPMGMFLSQSGPAESFTASAPEIVFRRDGQGELVLIGYTILSRGRGIAHRLAAPWSGGTGRDDDGWDRMPVVAAIAR